MKCPNCNHQWEIKPECNFDFEAIYKLYPRKQGKLNGIKRCRKSVKTKEDYQSLRKAIASFIAYHRKAGTQPQFIPLFSTFMSTWQEWLLPDTGTVKLEQNRETTEQYLDRQKSKQGDDIGWEEANPAKVREILDRALKNK